MRELPASGTVLGPRHQLNYDRWVAILQQEAAVLASNPPQHLNILAGDSLSLWFPTDLLPLDKTWLNQGISGEVSAGLLKRLKLFDRTQPQTIFLMIGINDMIRGVSDEDILWNYRRIVRRLKKAHPEAEIVIQSILPHGGEEATWEGKDRLLSIPKERIQAMNEQLQAMAQEESIKYLDLYPLFADDRGYLRPELSTDGLHLSRQGYLVWRVALQMFENKKIQPPSSLDLPAARGESAKSDEYQRSQQDKPPNGRS